MGNILDFCNSDESSDEFMESEDVVEKYSDPLCVSISVDGVDIE